MPAVRIVFSRERPAVCIGKPLLAWLPICIPLAVLAVASGEVLLQLTLTHQSAHVRAIAAVYMLTAAVVLGMSPIFGLLLGNERYRAFAALRALQAISLLIHVGLRVAGQLTVTNAAAATAAGWIAIFVVGAIMLRGYGPITKFDPAVAREGLWYGIKAHGNTTASLVALRLDLVLLPAFVTDHQLGLSHAIAASVSDLARLFLGALAVVVLPAAARRPERRGAVVAATAIALAASGIAAGLVIEAVAPQMLGVVYGDAFRPGALSLRLLVPGSIALLVSTAFVNGLLSLDRPFLASATQIPSAIFTVVTLLVVLPRGGGITSAAIVSTVSYTITLVTAWYLYRRCV